MDVSSERMRILELIDSGQISAEDGLLQLAALQDEAGSVDQAESPSPGVILSGPATISQGVNANSQIAPSGFATTYSSQEATAGTAQEVGTPPNQPIQPEIVSDTQREDFERWKHYWMIPLWIGVGITILGGLLMYWAMQSAHVGFWFICATLPFIFGVLVMALAAGSRTSPWLHLRVQQPPGERPQRIAISFPIPIGFTIWFLRTFRGHIPGLENVPVNLEDMLETMRTSASAEDPIYIRVDEEENGEKVEIFIG